jgi:hypothetical protein
MVPGHITLELSDSTKQNEQHIQALTEMWKHL